MAKNQNDKQLEELLDYFKKKSFRQDNTRYSGESRMSDGAIADLADELPTFAKAVSEAKKTFSKIFVGGAFKREHERYYKAIEDAAVELERANKTFAAQITRQYKQAMRSQEGNYKAQQELTNTMVSYARQAEVFKQIKEKFDEAEGKQRGELAKQVMEVAEVMNETAKRLRQYNVNIEEITDVNDDTVKRLSDFSDAVGILAKDSEVFASKLKQSYGQELEARQAFVAATAKAVADVTNKIFGTTESRLRAFQDSTRYVEAALRGLSPQEMNEFMQANRQALTLQGEAADRQYDELSSELKKYGFIGKDTADQITYLNDTLMRSGANATATNGKLLQNSIAQLRVMSGMSQESANAFAAEMLTSAEVMALTFGKTEEERLNIQQEQLTELTKIALSSGYSADYIFQMMKEQRAAKYKDVISKITGDVTLKAAIGEYERLTGRQLSQEQVGVLRKAGTGAPMTTAEQDLLLQTRTMMGADFERLKTESSSAIAGNNYGLATRQVPLEVLMGMAGIDMQQFGTDAMMATQVAETRGAAVRQMDVAGEVIKAMESLTKIEAGYLEVKELISGVQGSAVGGVASMATGAIGGIVGQLLWSKIAERWSKGKSNPFQGFPKPSPSITGGKPVGPSSKLPTKGRGKLGAILGIGSLLGIGMLASSDANASEGASPASGGGVDWGSMGLFAGMEAIAQRSNIMSFVKSGNMLNRARGMMTLGNAATLGKGLLKRVGPLGAIFGAYSGYNTDTEDYRKMFGFDPANGDTSIWSDLGVRTLGVLNDVASEMTFGLVDFANREALAMASGGTIDENGNVIPPGEEASVQVLQQIAENTSKTVEVIDEGNRVAAYMDEKKRAESAYAASQRKHVQTIMENHATLQEGANLAFNNSMRTIDAAF